VGEKEEQQKEGGKSKLVCKVEEYYTTSLFVTPTRY
jgi:hypothetical protein